MLRPLILLLGGAILAVCGWPTCLHATEIGDYLRERNELGTGETMSLEVASGDEFHDPSDSLGMFVEPQVGDESPTMRIVGWKRHLPPFLLPDLRISDPNDPTRHVGKGSPLTGTSWRNRPFHVGWLFGGLDGDDLVPGEVGQGNDLMGGYRIGWDFNHYWGTEGRFGFARLGLITAEGRTTRTSRNWFWDVHLLYYPWGDARWRPFASAGLGFADQRYVDARGRYAKGTFLGMPLGFGVKYYWKKWLALRGDVLDNIVFASDAGRPTHNFSYSLGVEVHVGPARRVYHGW